MIRRRRLVPAVVTLWLLAASEARPDAFYTVTDLGLAGNFGTNGIAKINDAGQVAFAGLVGGQSHVMLYTPGSGTADLGTVNGASMHVDALNNSGQIVGYYLSSTNVQGGFLYSGVQLQDLGPSGFIEANGINNSGVVVGSSSGQTGFQVLIDNNGIVVNLSQTPGGPPTVAGRMSINDSGQIVGNAGGSYNSGWFYDPGKLATPPSTVPTSLSIPAGLNNNGIAVGTANTNNFFQAATYDSSTGTTTFLGAAGGRSSFAFGINDTGTIVGSVQGQSDFGSYESYAMIDTGAGLVDLNSLIAPGSGWYLYEAYGINDRGQIVGIGYNGGNLDVFLLTPGVVPEPGSLVLLTAGMVGLALRRRAATRPGRVALPAS